MNGGIVPSLIHSEVRVMGSRKAFWVLIFLAILGIDSLDSYGDNSGSFILGREQGNGFLYSPEQILEGPDGNIYVYDSSDAFIKVYSPQGKFLRRMSGKGQGPGEFMRADNASFGFLPAGKLFFTEFFQGHRWITLMDLSGKFNKTIPIRIEQNFGMVKAIPLETGGFVADISFSGYNARFEKNKGYWAIPRMRKLLRIDPEGRVVSELMSSNCIREISFSDNGGDQWIPFVPSFCWFAGGKDSIFFSDGLSRRIKQISLDGSIIREIETDLPEPNKVTQKDLDRWREMRKSQIGTMPFYQRSGKVIEKYKQSIYDRKPNMDIMSGTQEGNLLVSKLGEDAGEENEFWLLDDKGKTKAHFDVLEGDLVLSKHFVFLMTKDEMDDTLVRAFPRQDSEEKDLKRIEELMSGLK